MENNLAPIVLFVYNRPWHTKQTLEALSQNSLANQSILYIYADGAKENATDAQLNEIKEVRCLIREKKWCKHVEIIEREKNIGVDNGIITTVTEILTKYEKIIVLEDDLVTSSCFLEYMNHSLNLYKNNNEVMVVSGYNFPKLNNLHDTFFLNGGTNPWGWGTWNRAWKYFNPDSKSLYESIIDLPKEKIRQFNFDNNVDYVGMLKSSINNNCPYDIRWYASVFLKGGYGLWPGKSLVQNIGHDNSGVHCKSSNIFCHKDLATKINVIKQEINHDKFAYSQIAKWYKRHYHLTIYNRIIFKLKNLFKKTSDKTTK